MEFKAWVDSSFTPLELDSMTEINCVTLREDISRGQRVEAFTLSARTPQGWKDVATGTTIGHKRIVTFPTVQADSIRLTVNQQRAESHILPVEVHHISIPEEK